MAKTITILLIFVLSIGLNAQQTTLDWDNAAVDNGDNVVETKDGITVTFTCEGAGTDPALYDMGADPGFYGVEYNMVLVSEDGTEATSATFTFNGSVDVVSILALEGSTLAPDYTFTPTGGSNSPVTATLDADGGGGKEVNLNWTGVTSFTVTSSGAAWMGFDNLVVENATLGTSNIVNQNKKITVSPNPVKSFFKIEMEQEYKNVNLTLVNTNGTIVYQKFFKTINNNTDISVPNLPSGMYILEVKGSDSSFTSKIIKE